LRAKELEIMPSFQPWSANLVTLDWANTFPFMLKSVG
jgi:hypothetical protein